MAGESFHNSDSSETGADECRAEPLRFAILHHTGYGLEHWDWFFEEDQALAAWKVYHDPLRRAKEPLELFKAAEHRKGYLEYEGPIDGRRGTVQRVACGTYRLIVKNSQCWCGELRSCVLAGTFRLEQVGGDRWQLRWSQADPQAGC